MNSSPDPRFYLLRNTMFNDWNVAEALIEQDSTSVEARSGTGETALHYVAIENHLEAVRWLVERGANINTRDNFQSSPLIAAASLGYLELCRFLLENGADIYAMNHVGQTAISVLVCGTKQVNRLLLELMLEHRGEADINLFFDDSDAENLLSYSGARVGDFWRALGLKSRYDESELD